MICSTSCIFLSTVGTSFIKCDGALFPPAPAGAQRRSRPSLLGQGGPSAADRLTRSIGTLLPITGSFLESGGVTTNPPEKLGFRAFRTSQSDSDQTLEISSRRAMVSRTSNAPKLGRDLPKVLARTPQLIVDGTIGSSSRSTTSINLSPTNRPTGRRAWRTSHEDGQS